MTDERVIDMVDEIKETLELMLPGTVKELGKVFIEKRNAIRVANLIRQDLDKRFRCTVEEQQPSCVLLMTYLVK